MDSIKQILIILLVVLVGFWYFGGFKLLNWFSAKRLKQQVADPLDSDELTSLRNQFASTQNITTQSSFYHYAIAQKLTHKDSWTKVAYEQDKNNPACAFFYASFLLKQAWSIRGTGGIKSLSAETIEAFRHKLNEAEFLLLEQVEKSSKPADLIFLILDVYLALGQRDKAETLLKKYEIQLKGRLDIAIKELKMLYPRWGGSHEKLQAAAEVYGLQSGTMIATTAYAYCHLIEDEGDKAFTALIKTKPLTPLIEQYRHLPKAPRQITSYDDFNLLLAHKLFARLFLYTNNKPLLKQALLNTSGHFSTTEAINPNTQGEVSFMAKAIDLGIKNFS